MIFKWKHKETIDKRHKNLADFGRTMANFAKSSQTGSQILSEMKDMCDW